MKGENRLSAPHTLATRSSLYARKECPNQVVKQECGSMRDPPQPASIDMGLHFGNGVSPDVDDDTGDALHRPNAYVTDVPRDGSVAPERWNA